MVRDAKAIVVATAVSSRTQVTADGAIETVTTVVPEDVLKGRFRAEAIDIVEPGGAAGDRVTFIPSVPRFTNGERYLLFLRNDDGRWHVANLALGLFAYRTDSLGREVLARDRGEINGWDPDGTPHREQPRAADRFVDYVRGLVNGAKPQQDYFIAPAPATAQSSATVAPLAAFSATSYTYTVSGSLGARWNVFPSGVTFYSVGSEPGAPGGGSTAITTAFASWNNDPGSNVNYVYGGADNGTHTQGLHAPDGANTVMFEQSLSSWGVPPFTCTSNSYSGTLGIGGVTNASGTHTGPNGESFATTQEADVMMNQGLANCSLLINSGDFNSAVTHEVGHTLGFRHSDQDRSDAAACPGGSLECSNTAIMKSFVSSGLNAQLHPWDQHAVDAVYPGTTSMPPPGGLAFDVDGNGTVDAYTDGILIIRRLLGASGTSLTLSGAVVGPGAQRTDPTAIAQYIDSLGSKLDVDGNGTRDAYTDGILIVRYMLGATGTSLTLNGAVVGPGCTRCTPSAIQSYLQPLVGR